MDDDETPKIKTVKAHCPFYPCDWKSEEVPLKEEPNAMWYAKQKAALLYKEHVSNTHIPRPCPYWEET